MMMGDELGCWMMGWGLMGGGQWRWVMIWDAAGNGVVVMGDGLGCDGW